MTFARLVTWRLKPGMRDHALDLIAGYTEEAKRTEGLTDVLLFRSVDDPETAYVLSMWDSEASMNTATGGIIKTVMDQVREMAVGPPSVKVLETREGAVETISMPT